jgi:hypothetical protein
VCHSVLTALLTRIFFCGWPPLARLEFALPVASLVATWMLARTWQRRPDALWVAALQAGLAALGCLLIVVCAFA